MQFEGTVLKAGMGKPGLRVNERRTLMLKSSYMLSSTLNKAKASQLTTKVALLLCCENSFDTGLGMPRERTEICGAEPVTFCLHWPWLAIRVCICSSAPPLFFGFQAFSANTAYALHEICQKPLMVVRPGGACLEGQPRGRPMQEIKCSNPDLAART